MEQQIKSQINNRGQIEAGRPEKKSWLKKGIAAAAAVCMAVTMSACGDTAETEPTAKEWIYVPEFLSLEEEDVNYYDMQYAGGALYYRTYTWDDDTQTSTTGLARYSLEEKTVSRIPLQLETESKGTEEDMNQYVNSVTIGSDGSIYGVAYAGWVDEKTGSYESRQSVVKFDREGKQIYAQDMDAYFEQNSNENYVRQIAADSQGRLYVFGEALVWLFDAQGAYQGTVTLDAGGNSWIQAVGCGTDGRIYAAIYSYDGSSSGVSLTAIDFDKKAVGESYENFPNGNDETLVAWGDNQFLINDSSRVYEYNPATQTKTLLFDWLDSDIDGYNVQRMGVLEDGRLLVVVQDWENDDNFVAVLTKTPGSQVEQKETIVLATLGGGRELQAAAVKFNRENDKYRLVIKKYMDYDTYTEENYNSAITRLNNDITSKNNCPDLIEINNLNEKQLVAKGVFADLGSFLDKGGALKREDILEGVLAAYTVDGVLVALPSSFNIETVIGRASDVGDRTGWTVQELIEFAQAHPGAELFDMMEKSSIMYYIMSFNQDAFVDWTKRECSFDSQEFKDILNFVNSFPDEVDWESRQASTPTRIQNGQVLLEQAYLYDFNEIQMYYEIFGGEISCVGYPTVDGSAGTAISPEGSMLAISSKSRKQDAAWEFLESYLTKDSAYYSWGFPIQKSKLDAMAEEAVEVRYITDGDGNPVLDENGEPIEEGTGGGIGYEDGWSYTYRRATQEEVDLIYSLIDIARPVSDNNSQVMQIITEEAEGFYKGQKSADEVAKIIQSRVSLYVSENN